MEVGYLVAETLTTSTIAAWLNAQVLAVLVLVLTRLLLMMVPRRLDSRLHRHAAKRLHVLIVVHHLRLLCSLMIKLLLPEATARLRRRLAVVRDVLVDIILDLRLRKLRHSCQRQRPQVLSMEHMGHGIDAFLQRLVSGWRVVVPPSITLRWHSSTELRRFLRVVRGRSTKQLLGVTVVKVTIGVKSVD